MGTTAIHCCAVHVPDRAKHMLSSNMSFTMAVGCGGLWCPSGDLAQEAQPATNNWHLSTRVTALCANEAPTCKMTNGSAFGCRCVGTRVATM